MHIIFLLTKIIKNIFSVDHVSFLKYSFKKNLNFDKNLLFFKLFLIIEKLYNINVRPTLTITQRSRSPNLYAHVRHKF